ncbi:hypothetical protein TS85_00345 [Sphingomonas hengshuiensis]|uniref:Uncharacterized protein n=2 Tax=Sphingomonas hengshuiensis TaxID=1609977 RepID=A0A7U5HV85_9SPHN|nr:hypothetical protein TS85_00345 [Sphingomonas hengshuiensis]
MHACTVREMVQEITAREGMDLVKFFDTKSDRSTEFTLYYARLVANQTQSMHLVDGPNGLFTMRIGTTEQRRAALRRGLKGDSRFWCFGIHRKHLIALPPEDRELTLAVWMKHGLFDSLTEATSALDKLERHFNALADQERARFEVARLHRKRLKPRPV